MRMQIIAPFARALIGPAVSLAIGLDMDTSGPAAVALIVAGAVLHTVGAVAIAPVISLAIKRRRAGINA